MAHRQKELGDLAEEIVARWLRAQGLTIVGRNVRLGMLELDIVARDGPVIVIVEVRARHARSFTTGFSSIGWQKKKRLKDAGRRLWDRRYARDSSVERLRFDVASVRLDTAPPELEYVKAAL